MYSDSKIDSKRKWGLSQSPEFSDLASVLSNWPNEYLLLCKQLRDSLSVFASVPQTADGFANRFLIWRAPMHSHCHVNMR